MGNLRIIYKLILLSFLTMVSIGCSSCGPAELETTAEEEVFDPIYWDTCSNVVGDHACNFTLLNQKGEEVSLYDFYGKVVLVDFSTEWCGYCRVAASEAQRMQDKYGEENFVHITVLVETSSGAEPSPDDLQLWMDTYGITSAVVLSGSRSMLDPSDESYWSVTGWPTFFILDRDMKVFDILRGYSIQMLEEIVDEAIKI